MQVPISVVHKNGAVALDGTDALVLYVYGAYGMPTDVDFDATRLSLLDRLSPALETSPSTESSGWPGAVLH